MIGKRLPVIDGKPAWPENPGDYCGPFVDEDGSTKVIFLKPNARDPGAPRIARVIHHVTTPPHSVKENPDGTLTISPSLGDHHGELPDSKSDGWHGYLERGMWRKV